MTANSPVGFSFGFIASLLFISMICGGIPFLTSYAEDHPATALLVIKGQIVAVGFIHISLLFDGVAPQMELIVSLLCILIYSTHLQNFPYVFYYSLKSVTSAVAFVACHVLWFNYFRSQDTSDMITLVGFYFVMVIIITIRIIILYNKNYIYINILLQS